MAKKEQQEQTADPVEKSQEEALSELLEKEKNARLQVMADFDNYRKRIESERATFGAIANMGLIKELLEVFDDLQMAMNDEGLELDSAKNAIQNAQQKLRAAAAAAGVEALEVKPGDEFDSATMEAITTVPDEKQKNKVVAVISSGFKHSNKDGIISPAKVVVGK